MILVQQKLGNYLISMTIKRARGIKSRCKSNCRGRLKKIKNALLNQILHLEILRSILRKTHQESKMKACFMKRTSIGKIK